MGKKATTIGGVGSPSSATVPAGAGLYYDSTGALVVGIAPNPGNIAGNGRFDILDGSGNPVAWHLAGSATVSSTAIPGGNHSVSTGITGSAVTFLSSDPIAISAAQSYYAQFIAEVDSGSSAAILFYADIYDNTNTLINTVLISGFGSTPTTWTQTGSQFAVPAGNGSTVKLRWTVQGSGSGQARIGSVALVNTIVNPYIAQNAIAAGNMQANSITAAGGAVAANAIVDSNIAAMNVSKLIAGTVIFTGTVFFSQGSANPVMELSSTDIYLFGVAATGGGSGLTSSPYININNSLGVLVSSGGTGPSVTINGGGGVTVWQVNGSVAHPYVSVSGTGVLISDGGSTTLTASAGAVTIQNGSTQASMSASGFVASNGANSVTVNGSGVVIVGGSLTSPSITGGAMSGTTLTLAATSTGVTKTVTLNPAANFATPVLIQSSTGTSVSLDPDLGVFVRFGLLRSNLQYNGLQFNGAQVLTTRQTGPGTPSGWADSTAQTWAGNLLTALQTHGMVT